MDLSAVGPMTVVTTTERLQIFPSQSRPSVRGWRQKRSRLNFQLGLPLSRTMSPSSLCAIRRNSAVDHWWELQQPIPPARPIPRPRLPAPACPPQAPMISTDHHKLTTRFRPALKTLYSAYVSCPAGRGAAALKTLAFH